jgi:hypothetical protein
MLVTEKQLREGKLLQPLEPITTTFKKMAKGRPRTTKSKLVLPDTHNPWKRTSSSALRSVFGEDGLGAKSLALFQSSMQSGTY